MGRENVPARAFPKLIQSRRSPCHASNGRPSAEDLQSHRRDNSAQSLPGSSSQGSLAQLRPLDLRNGGRYSTLRCSPVSGYCNLDSRGRARALFIPRGRTSTAPLYVAITIVPSEPQALCGTRTSRTVNRRRSPVRVSQVMELPALRPISAAPTGVRTEILRREMSASSG